MLKFHLMPSYREESLEAMKKAAEDYDQAGYTSVLYTFNSSSCDFFIKVAHSINTNHSFKYLFALRPYHVSPQYLMMITKSFEEIQHNRLSINWLAGDFDTRRENDEANYQLDVFGESRYLNDLNNRKKFVRNFINSYTNLLNKHKVHIPDYIFSGRSDYTLETADLFKGFVLCMIDDYIKDLSRYNSEKTIASVKILVRSTQEKAQNKLNEFIEHDRQRSYSIAGDVDHINKELQKLEKLGLKNLMISTYHQDSISQLLINKIIKQYSRSKNE